MKWYAWLLLAVLFIIGYYVGEKKPGMFKKIGL